MSFGELSLDEDAKEMERESARIRQETERALKSSANQKQPRSSSASPYRASPSPFSATSNGNYGAALTALQAIQVGIGCVGLLTKIVNWPSAITIIVGRGL